MNVKEALQVLEKAAASDADDIKQIFSSEYKHLRKAVIKHAPHALLDKLKDAKAKDIDRSVHDNPWYYIGGAAALACLVGFMAGRSKK
jgi:ElaB/YqjD/DUF883 family membrane-anchored ribosome-binding protein